MSLGALIFMLFSLISIWGGLIFFLTIAMKKNKKS